VLGIVSTRIVVILADEHELQPQPVHRCAGDARNVAALQVRTTDKFVESQLERIAAVLNPDALIVLREEAIAQIFSKPASRINQLGTSETRVRDLRSVWIV